MHLSFSSSDLIKGAVGGVVLGVASSALLWLGGRLTGISGECLASVSILPQQLCLVVAVPAGARVLSLYDCCESMLHAA